MSPICLINSFTPRSRRDWSHPPAHGLRPFALKSVCKSKITVLELCKRRIIMRCICADFSRSNRFNRFLFCCSLSLPCFFLFLFFFFLIFCAQVLKTIRTQVNRLAGAATSIIFVAIMFCRDRHNFVATKDVFCRDKTRVCRDESMLVATKLFSQQVFVARNKSMLVATKLLSQQLFVATKQTCVTCGSSCQ